MGYRAEAISAPHRPPPALVPGAAHEVLRQQGQPLPSDLRRSMEARFHHDFSTVQVHADSRAAEAAGALRAEAYAAGPHIVFGHNRFAPHTEAGTRLLAHELAHVVQADGKTTSPSRLGERGDAAERAADHAAEGAMRGSFAPTALAADAAPTLHRQEADPTAAAREQIISLAEAGDAASRQQALDLILSTYYQRPPHFDGIFYDANLHSTSPQDAETGPSPGQASFGGQMRITIGPRFFNNLRSRYDQRIRTIGHELQHVGQRSPEGGRSVGSTFGGIGLGAGIGGAAAGIGLGIAAAAHTPLSAGLIGGVVGGAAALGGLIGGIADPFGGSQQPVRNSHSREFLAIHWTLTSQVRGLGALPRGQALTAITYPHSGALGEWSQMPAEDQQRYRAQYDEIMALKAQLEAETAAPAAAPATPAAAPAGAH